MSKCNLWKAVKEKFKERFKENYDSEHPWTIYFLVDLKVVYIMTYALITIVNLISSTANSEAYSDRNSMVPFNVSSEYMNVNVTSINDAILWNCRRHSETNSYYRFLYWMLIIAMTVALTGFLIIKFITLITLSNSFGSKYCRCKCSTFNHGLTKLWHLAICKHLNTLVIYQHAAEKDRSAEIDRIRKIFEKWLCEDIREEIVKKLSCGKDFFRSIIPYILLVLLASLMCLGFLSFDLHPLACIAEPNEELITYNYEKGTVELEFSNQLSSYRIAAGCLFLILGITFIICVKLFFYCTNLVVNEMEQQLLEESKHFYIKTDENNK